MKGLVVYSSNTGNTKKLAEEIYNGVSNMGDWSLEDVKNVSVTDEYDVVLLGGWAESGTLDKASLALLNNMNKSDKKIGLFITMGSRTKTEHGKFCENNLTSLLKDCNSLGVKLMQGKISDALMTKLAGMPDSVIPVSVKIAMQDGVDNYIEPSAEDYKKIAQFYAEQLM